MKEVKFKVGDLVYCPLLDTKVYQIEYAKNCKKELVIKNHRLVYFFDETGNPNMNYKDSLPFIFHATQENYELLSKLYPNVSFEPPPKRKEPKEIIKAMLKAGHKYILCEVYCSGDYRDYHGTDSIIGIDEHDGSFIGGTEQHYWETATPINSKGQKIIDFIDGKCVLENGEVME